MSKLEKILKEPIRSARSVGGGCIANAQKLETISGKEYFLKSYSETGSDILRNEANGLKELAKADSIRVPEVIFHDDDILLLEFIRTGSRRTDFSEIFGRQFADMHRFTADRFGFFENNFIGATPQINAHLSDNWAEFYWEHRLLYQFKLAEHNGYVNESFRNSFTSLESRIPKLLDGTEEPPSLLHGDLWSGNYMVDDQGNPVLIDPAVYYGHREADLGMTRLFGGFDNHFYAAYNELFPLPAGWESRIDLYKLYHVLNHLNLFGTSYYSHAVSIVKSYI